MPESFSFNLVDEPWLPCLAEGARREELSLREVLARAPEIREIVDASPLVTAAVHRLLLAILHRCFGPASDGEWRKLWDRGTFDMGAVNEYLDKWRHRFDLFDARRPFYQVGGSGIPPVSVAKLAHERNDKNAAILFDHSLEDDPAPMSAAEAARHILAVQSFALGGLVSRLPGEGPSAKAAPLAKGLAVLLVGSNVFETLLLNLIQLDGASGQPFEFEPAQDLPAWEQDAPAQPEARYPYGYLDLLTWQSRRLFCVPWVDQEGKLGSKNAIVARGREFPEGFEVRTRETMVPYKRSTSATATDAPWLPLQLSRDKVLWRDSITLIQQTNSVTQQPRAFEWFAHLQQSNLVPRNLEASLSVFGLLYDPQKTAEAWLWRHERLPLPLAYLQLPELVAELERGVGVAENVRTVLGRRFATLARYLLIPGWDQLSESDRNKQWAEIKRPRRRKSRLDNLFATLNWERPYWTSLDSAFRTLMVDLAEAWGRGEQDGPLRAWAAVLRDAANEAFEGAVRSVEASGRGLRAAAEARASLHAQLSRELDRFLPTGKEETA